MVPFVFYLTTDEAADINGCTFLVAGDKIALYSEPQEYRTINRDEYTPGRAWTVGDLVGIVPGTLAKDLVNPAPKQDK